jgi:2-polyprenyl-6-hydroxyphenyl methylase/3-demethylubiquinone-9 3-methyltransferase
MKQKLPDNVRRSRARLPEYRRFQEVCDSGLSALRPLNDTAKKDDQWGWNYGQAWPPSYWAFGRMRALFTLMEASLLRPKRVLEVAAGDAALCASLAKLGCEVFANDLRRENLQAAVQHFTNHENIQILPGNLFDLNPAETGLFDLVIACEIVEHVAHTEDFLSQLKKFLSPGGHIFLTTPNGSYFLNNLPTYSQVEDFAALESQQFQPDADGHLFLITPGEMCQLARKVDLKVERMDIWATPVLTGHAGFRLLSSRVASRLHYGLERLCQSLPFSARERLCTELFVLLSN